jgi:outer membrane protein assembly factor BamD (BamD/ComL family)
MGAILLATAPVQCGQTPESELRLDETPGDALWQLAQRFQAEHDEEAARQTMRFLVERYPSSRWARAARDALDRDRGADGGR